MFLVDVIGVNQVRGLPFRVDELVAAVRGVLDGTAVRTPIGSAGRMGTLHSIPTIEVGAEPEPEQHPEPDPDPESLVPATNGASR
jgi:hypothetical protein